MESAKMGMSIVFFVATALYFIQKKRGGGWKTAYYIVAWIFGLSFWFQVTVHDARLPIVYVASLVAVAAMCYVKRKAGQSWLVGFWVSLLYTVPPVFAML